MFVCNTWIMKMFFKIMNYEKFKCPFENTRIMKKLNICLQYRNSIYSIFNKKCLFAIHKLWKNENLLSIHELWKYFFKIHELWKNETVCSQCMNYENFFCNKLIMKLRKCLFAILKLWKHETICLQYMNMKTWTFLLITWIMKISVCNTWIMKYKNVCLQYTNYEKMKIFVVNTWIMKIFV